MIGTLLFLLFITSSLHASEDIFFPAPTREECKAFASATDIEIKQHLLKQSIASCGGTCPCPENVDRAGKECGDRSAYKRPGGCEPWCYLKDVPEDAVPKFRESCAGHGEVRDSPER
jgi:hypothetical protein